MRLSDILGTRLSDILDVGRIDTDFTATSKSLALAALSNLLVQGAVESGAPALLTGCA